MDIANTVQQIKADVDYYKAREIHMILAAFQQVNESGYLRGMILSGSYTMLKALIEEYRKLYPIDPQRAGTVTTQEHAAASSASEA